MKLYKQHIRIGIFLIFIIGFLCCQVFGQKEKGEKPKLSVTRAPISENSMGVSVKDFGAVGDGLTDDTYAIQQAVNSGAGSVYFPTTLHGYKIGTITIRKPITIYGDNKQATPVTPLRSNMAMFVSYSTFVTFKGLYFVTYNGVTKNDTAIVLRGSINTIDDCFFSGMSVGIYNDSRYNPDEQYIKNCRFRDCEYGITSDGHFRNTRISDNCIFHGCKCAINLYDNNDYIHTTEGVVIENSMIYDCGDAAIRKGAINIENCDFTFIRNCMIDLNRYLALSVSESKWCDFSGTYFSSNHSGNASAIKINGDCSDLFMLNCRVFDSRSWGVEVQGNKRNPSNITLSDCSFRLNPAGDIFVNGASGVKISRSNLYSTVPTSIAAISNDGVSSITISECYIKGGITKGGATQMTLKDNPNQPTSKTGNINFPKGNNKVSFAHGLLVLPGQSVIVAVTSTSSESISAVADGKNIILTRTSTNENVTVSYRAEVI